MIVDVSASLNQWGYLSKQASSLNHDGFVFCSINIVFKMCVIICYTFASKLFL